MKHNIEDLAMSLTGLPVTSRVIASVTAGCYDDLRLDENGDIEVDNERDLKELKTRIAKRLREPQLPEKIRAAVAHQTGIVCSVVEVDRDDPNKVIVTYQKPDTDLSFYGRVYMAARDVTPDYIRIKVNEVVT